MEETIAAPVQSDVGETTSTETQTATQVVSEPQGTNGNKVEVADNKPQETVPQRKPSDFFRERQKIRSLEDTISNLNKRYEEQQRFLDSLKPKPEDSRLTVDQLLADPEGTFKTREQRLMAEIQKIREEISAQKDEKVNQERNQSELEALEMLFPKSSPEANETLEQRLENEDRKELLENLFKANPGLDRLFRISPKEAAELVLVKLNQSKPSSPKTINKSLMGSTQRGNPTGGTRVQNTIESKVAELKMLGDEMKDKPELRFDMNHKNKRDEINRDINRLLKEEGTNK